jgi:hypothetical protein
VRVYERLRCTCGSERKKKDSPFTFINGTASHWGGVEAAVAIPIRRLLRERIALPQVTDGLGRPISA